MTELTKSMCLNWFDDLEAMVLEIAAASRSDETDALFLEDLNLFVKKAYEEVCVLIDE